MNLYASQKIKKAMPVYRVIPIRHRYVFTKSNRLRLRYIAGSVMAALVLGTGLFTDISNSKAYTLSTQEQASFTVSKASSQPHQIIEIIDNQKAVPDETLDLDQVEEAVAEIIENEPVLRDEVIEIASGDTVAGALQRAGVSGVEAYHAVKAMSKYFDPRDVKPGQKIEVKLLQAEEDALSLQNMHMRVSAIKEIDIHRDENGRYYSDLNEKEVKRYLSAAKTHIETSIYGSAARDGIPTAIVADMIRIYSYEVDFQRDIRQGDTAEIFYEVYKTEDGELVKYGDIIYANLNVAGHEIPVYRYEYDGASDYYRENGTSLRRTLMKTPVDGARISSGFGMRRHPVLGYNKMHKGIDFAAPRGTPIYAAGDGVIEKAGRNGGYGNYMRIRHNSELKTAYAHMKGFARGLSAGKRVKQGQIIGYVGTTGRSTGPHLHFEVLRDDKQINPRSIKSSPGQQLAGTKLEEFKEMTSQIRQKYAALSTKLKFAKNEVGQ